MSNVTTSELDQLRDSSRDATVTDGDKYKVVLENDRIRVLEYRDSPGQRTSPHHHPDYVLCALSAPLASLCISIIRGEPVGSGQVARRLPWRCGGLAAARRLRCSGLPGSDPVRPLLAAERRSVRPRNQR
jgi:hypothetical protein